MYLAYIFERVGRVGLSVSAGELATNAQFNYNYSVAVRADFPIALSKINYITPSASLGIINSNISNEIDFHPIINLGAYYEHDLNKKISLMAGVYSPLSLDILNYDSVLDIWMQRIVLDINIGFRF